MTEVSSKSAPLLGKDVSEEERASLREKYSAKGWAPIKPEFMIVHKPEANKAADADDPSAPPAKRQKLKGRNKRRPRPVRTANSGPRLCPHLIAAPASSGSCPFGTSCCLSHDLASYAANRPEDLGAECPVFKSRGRCDMGLTCRFGAGHIDAEGRNRVDEEKFARHKAPKNSLGVELQRTLRKRDYDFTLSFEVLDNLGVYVDPRQRGNHPSRPSDKEAKLKDDTIATSPTKSTPVAESDVHGERDAANIGDNPNGDSEVTSSTGNDGPKTESSDPDSGAVGEPEVAASDQDGDVTGTAEVAPTPECGSNGVAKNTDMDHGGDDSQVALRKVERKKLDFTNKTYLAPLTTVGNLPFRRVCKDMGVDITCGEMAMATNLLQGKKSEWALLRRHPSETIFGVQLCGSHPDMMTKCAQLVSEQCEVDFVDVNCGCPIDLVYQKGEGSGLMRHQKRLESIARGMSGVLSCPLTVKMRTGIQEDKNNAHLLVPRLAQCGVSLVTIHGRTREQRYTRVANWKYIEQCVAAASPMPVFGNGDVLTWEDAVASQEASGVAGCMVARGALIKPWIFTEIRERRHWDISAAERLDVLRQFTNYGLEHWGSDERGVETTRRFLLEWLSFLHRYIPVGLLERLPQRINDKPPLYVGRSDLETLLSSPNANDWVKISEMLLGPVPETFIFLPKHKANSYAT